MNRKVIAVEKPANQEHVPIDIQDLLKTLSGVHIVGKPGSGKTALLRRLLSAYSGAYLAGTSKLIPVYIEFKQADIFDRIIHDLQTHLPARYLKLVDRDWLTTELRRGRFLFLIDDVHRGISDQAGKESSRINELLDFNENTFVLAARDYVTRADYGLAVYRLADLSSEETKEIIKLESSEGEADSIFGQMWWHSPTRDLYDTPQMIIFSARVFKKLGRLPINKSVVFREYMKMKFEAERRKDPLFNENLVQRILGGLAFEMMKSQSNPYLVDELNALGMVQNVRQSLITQYGFRDNSAEWLLEQILRSGFIVHFEGGYRFEHDQWQEFFAANQVFESNLPLQGIRSPYPLKEVASFLLGFFSPEGNEEERKQFRGRIDELIQLDFFLLSQCIKDSKREFEEKLLGQKEGRIKIDLNPESIRQAYERLLESYCGLIEREFPRLRQKFPPETHGPIGILVITARSEPGYSYGYRRLKSEGERKVLLASDPQDSTGQTTDWQFFERYAVDSLRWKAYDPVLYDIPLLGAHQDITDALGRIIREKNLCESAEIRMERAFFETTALRRHLGIPSDRKSLTVGEILAGIKKRRIALFVAQRFTQNRSIDNAGLNSEVERLYAEGFDPPPENRSTTLVGSYVRPVKDTEYEASIKYLLENRILTEDDSLKPLLEILPREMRFKKTPQLTDAEIETLKHWTTQYYEKVYLNYLEMMEANFPKVKSSFRTYSRFPIHLVLVEPTSQQKTERFGARHEFGRFPEQKQPLKISVVQETKFENMRHFSLRHLPHIRSSWMLPHSAWDPEPVRTAVYKMIEDEFRDLTN
ncbi:MAG: hypothetical protein Q8P51_07360 [Ignavibacteria bacterium]|nr:hypothetical protein [Ignavibacteria bacterium]